MAMRLHVPECRSDDLRVVLQLADARVTGETKQSTNLLSDMIMVDGPIEATAVRFGCGTDSAAALLREHECFVVGERHPELLQSKLQCTAALPLGISGTALVVPLVVVAVAVSASAYAIVAARHAARHRLSSRPSLRKIAIRHMATAPDMVVVTTAHPSGPNISRAVLHKTAAIRRGSPDGDHKVRLTAAREAGHTWHRCCGEGTTHISALLLALAVRFTQTVAVLRTIAALNFTDFGFHGYLSGRWALWRED